MTRSTLTTGAEIVGAGLCAAAAWLVAIPLGLLVAGAFLLLFGYLGDR